MKSAPSISARLVGFTAFLRARGFAVGPAHSLTALAAVTGEELADIDHWRRLWRAVYAHSPDQVQRFGPLFDQYWLSRSAAPARGGAAAAPSVVAAVGDGAANHVTGSSPQPRSGALEPLPRTAEAWEAAGRRLGQSLRQGRGRRLGPARQGRLDLRRSLAATAQRPWAPPRFRAIRPARARLWLLIDVSGSMREETAAALLLAQGLVRAAPQVRVATFSTAVAEVTSLLRRASALTLVPQRAPDWQGGTLLAVALRWVLAQTGPGEVWILSDGLDASPPGQVALGLAALARTQRRVLWLNPLAGHPHYRPATRVLQEALPYLSALLPLARPEDTLALVRGGTRRALGGWR